jgi:hypothetical protein
MTVGDQRVLQHRDEHESYEETRCYPQYSSWKVELLYFIPGRALKLALPKKGEKYVHEKDPRFVQVQNAGAAYDDRRECVHKIRSFSSKHCQSDSSTIRI